MANSLKIGPGIDNNDVTPVMSATQQKMVLHYCDQAQEQGATLITGGKKAAGHKGYFVEPTVFGDVSPDSDIFKQEVFGPVLAITPFDTEEQAWDLANATDYGLVAGIFSTDINRCLRGTKLLRAGQIFVNEWYAGGIETPFGGTGLSGYGREKGQEALYSYVQTKNVGINIS